MRILFSGDVAWNIGRYALAQALPVLKKEWGGFDFVVINCENAAARARRPVFQATSPENRMRVISPAPWPGSPGRRSP